MNVLNEKMLLFEEDVRLVEIKEYGFSFKAFMQKRQSLPPEGLQFDIHFEGKVFGELINGNIVGVDYLTVRSDGRLFLNLHAIITTNDGARIKVTESGINDMGTLRLSMNFHTNDARYMWLNQKHVWGVGEVNFETGQVKIKGYQH
jgi:hypothetical protein